MKSSCNVETLTKERSCFHTVFPDYFSCGVQIMSFLFTSLIDSVLILTVFLLPFITYISYFLVPQTKDWYFLKTLCGHPSFFFPFPKTINAWSG